jgi:hypothetical protein
MGRLRRAIKEDPDRLISDALFIAFGVSALIDGPRSQSATPVPFQILFNVEFIVLGILLMVGTITENYRLKVLGFTIYIIALGTVGLLIAAVSQSVTSLLIIAVAIRGYTSIKEMQRRRQFISELEKAVRPEVDDADS